MELLQLRYFLEVARSQHVTKTARKLHVSQPTVTQALRRLENELGAELFEHVGRSIRLTRCGEDFLERIEPAIALIDEAEHAARTFENRETKVVRMNVLAASALTVDAIASYSALHPEVLFQITHSSIEGNSDIIVRMPVSRGRRSRPSESGPLAETHAFTERIMLAIPSDAHPACSELSLTDVVEEKFILLAGSKNLRDTCDALCARHGFTPTAVFESDNPSVVRKMIGLGLGVGFWPEKSWGVSNEDGARLVALREDGFERTIEVSLKNRKEGDARSDFYDFIISFFEDVWKKDEGTKSDSIA